jgi:hypothetical protein
MEVLSHARSSIRLGVTIVGFTAAVKGCVSPKTACSVCAGDEKAEPGPMVYLFAPSGRILKTFPVPAAPVSCCLVEKSLYVTCINGALYRARSVVT